MIIKKSNLEVNVVNAAINNFERYELVYVKTNHSMKELNQTGIKRK